jgi:AcrR family transcriptional regulator
MQTEAAKKRPAEARRSIRGSTTRSPGSARELILDTALDLFAESGFDGLTLRQVGARVGLHNSSLFHYFRTKREIIGAVLRRESEELLTRLEPLADDDPPSLDRFVTVLLAVSDHYAREPRSARAAMRLFLDPGAWLDPYASEIDAKTPDPSHRLVRFTALLWGWLDRAQAARVVRPLDTQQAARNLFGLLLMDPIWTSGRRRSDRSPDRRRSELEAFVRGALSARAGISRRAAQRRGAAS